VLRIALTGGIGSGKSTVAEQFSARGITIVDADVVAHGLTRPGSPALAEIIARFGREILTADGTLDRASLRRLVFADASARNCLEEILHPRVWAEMEEQAAMARSPYVLLVIPLLFETGRRDIADRVLVVDVPEALQIERVHARNGLARAEIKRIMASQVGREARLAGADDMIDNSGEPSAIAPQVDALHARYLRLAEHSDSLTPPTCTNESTSLS